MALNDIRSRFSQALYGTETFSYSENLIPLLPQRPQTSVSDHERSSMDLPTRDDEDSRLNINASHSEYESLVSEDVTGEELGLLSQREDSMIAPDAPTTEEKLRLRRVSGIDFTCNRPVYGLTNSLAICSPTHH
ncbi:hypothetical protein FRC02_005710 [Tulasnella sp. 418]|nr:hypothetical protein FRC02_005710 [Tulasnella sp. 418]